jgi:hypothetical protein
MDKVIQQIPSVVNLIAAYGRSYATAEAAISAWKSGKDFKIMGGPYTSIRDIGILKWDFPNGIYILYDNGKVKVD